MAAPVYSKANVTPMPIASCSRTYHPSFSSLEADVVLRSTEGTLYRVDSYTLLTTSGLFETMFRLPQPKTQYESSSDCQVLADIRETEEIDVYESDDVLERLLPLLCGLVMPRWNTLDQVERILTVAEKWDTPGPIANIRSALTSPHFLRSEPLRIYALAKHFDWPEEAKLASTHTLTLDLHDPSHAPILERMSSKDLLPLLQLHRARRDQFRLLIDSPERFTAGNRYSRDIPKLIRDDADRIPVLSSPYHCSRCGVTQLDNHTWRELKNAMFLEIDRRPLGDTLGVACGESAEWPESLACWEAKCKKEGCGGFNYDRIATLRQIRNCIDSLPLTIEV